MLATVWSSLLMVKMAAFGTLVSFSMITPSFECKAASSAGFHRSTGPAKSMSAMDTQTGSSRRDSPSAGSSSRSDSESSPTPMESLPAPSDNDNGSPDAGSRVDDERGRIRAYSPFPPGLHRVPEHGGPGFPALHQHSSKVGGKRTKHLSVESSGAPYIAGDSGRSSASASDAEDVFAGVWSDEARSTAPSTPLQSPQSSRASSRCCDSGVESPTPSSSTRSGRKQHSPTPQQQQQFMHPLLYHQQQQQQLNYDLEHQMALSRSTAYYYGGNNTQSPPFCFPPFGPPPTSPLAFHNFRPAGPSAFDPIRQPFHQYPLAYHPGIISPLYPGMQQRLLNYVAPPPVMMYGSPQHHHHLMAAYAAVQPPAMTSSSEGSSDIVGASSYLPFGLAGMEEVRHRERSMTVGVDQVSRDAYFRYSCTDAQIVSSRETRSSADGLQERAHPS